MQPWVDAGEWPYYLRDAFDAHVLSLAGVECLLAIEKRSLPPGLAGVASQVERARVVAGLPVVYVTRALASFERRRLIELKVPFLVPGNQLYLPPLGIDLREHFRAPVRTKNTTFSPATQALLTRALLRLPWRAQWHPADLVGDLGYTAMTVSRASRELVAAGVATVRTVGRTRGLYSPQPPDEIWRRVATLMRNPVRRRFYARPVENLRGAARVAGLSALARHSLLAEPSVPVVAIGPAQWTAAQRDGITILPAPLPGAWEWELWSYSPALLAAGDTVDPLSLALSLRDDPDERVGVALDELGEQRPW